MTLNRTSPVHPIPAPRSPLAELPAGRHVRCTRADHRAGLVECRHDRPAGRHTAVRNTAGGAILAVLVLLGLALSSPSTAQAATPAVPCALYPWSPECAPVLGARVRPDLAAVGVGLAGVGDRELGELIFDLCFHGRPRGTASMADPATRDIALNLTAIQSVKGRHCG